MCCQPQHCRTSYASSRNRATTDSFRISGRVHKPTAWRARAAKARRKTRLCRSVLFRNFDAGVGRRPHVLTGWSRRGLAFYGSGTRRSSRPLAGLDRKQTKQEPARPWVRDEQFCSFAFRRTPSSGARIDRRRPSRERSRAEFCFVAPDRSVAKRISMRRCRSRLPFRSHGP